eukprot:TRINITY_DN5258_c0_g1_i1.p2 TRINITY_DN5258_c0_g1~~TRINITY_DN5258_c0_g1_i1.p2  ORF type:complete len:281 (-),score=98.18 TRINITY_DN5258_c0_g1_i1:301-1143(-)
MSASTKVYIGKMSAESANESEIKDRFRDFGEIIGEPVIKSNPQFHYAFIEYASEESARRAVDEMDNKTFNGSRIVVEIANGGRTKGDCHICGESGHWKKNCPKGSGRRDDGYRRGGDRRRDDRDDYRHRDDRDDRRRDDRDDRRRDDRDGYRKDDRDDRRRGDRDEYRRRDDRDDRSSYRRRDDRDDRRRDDRDDRRRDDRDEPRRDDRRRDDRDDRRRDEPRKDDDRKPIRSASPPPRDDRRRDDRDRERELSDHEGGSPIRSKRTKETFHPYSDTRRD